MTTRCSPPLDKCLTKFAPTWKVRVSKLVSKHLMAFAPPVYLRPSQLTATVRSSLWRVSIIPENREVAVVVKTRKALEAIATRESFLGHAISTSDGYVFFTPPFDDSLKDVGGQSDLSCHHRVRIALDDLHIDVAAKGHWVDNIWKNPHFGHFRTSFRSEEELRNLLSHLDRLNHWFKWRSLQIFLEGHSSRDGRH